MSDTNIHVFKHEGGDWRANVTVSDDDVAASSATLQGFESAREAADAAKVVAADLLAELAAPAAVVPPVATVPVVAAPAPVAETAAASDAAPADVPAPETPEPVAAPAPE